MNIEYQFILSLLKNKNVKDTLFYFDENELKNPDCKIYFNFIKSHFKRYNEFPSIETMNLQFNEDFNISEGIEQEKVYYDKILDKNNREKYLKIVKKAAELIANDSDLQLVHETILHNIKKIKNNDENIISANIGRNAIKRLEYYNDKKFNVVYGFSWGLKDINRDSKLDIETPIAPGRLFMIQARPGVGKTFLCCATAANLAKNNIKTLFISKEMSVEEVLERVDAFVSKISYTRLKKCLLTAEECEQYANYLKSMENKEYLEVKQPKECTQETIRQLIQEEAPQVVIIDYLQLLKDSQKSKEPRLQYKNIIYDLKNMSQEFKIPIILISATNREGAKNEESPDLENISESDAIGYALDAAFSLYQTEQEEMMQTMNLKCIKNRHGKKFTIKLLWDIDNSLIKEQ